MIQRVMNNPGPVGRLAVKIKMDLPYFWLSEEEGLILCGKIDWLEYLQESDGVHIIDFKTSKGSENPESLQLPIYQLLTMNCQNRKVVKASYWYLERNDEPMEVPLPDMDECREKLLKTARQIKVARKLERFKCEYEGGCAYCKPMEAILKGDAEFVGTDAFNQDVYIFESLPDEMPESEIL
jgi:ATP-dependent helicase/DNAse subunit B